MEIPSKTVELLDELKGLGFDDTSFWRVHHFREKGECESIRSHRDHCKAVKSFQAHGTNALVQRRLRLIRDAYRKGGFSSGRSEVFQWLAEAAYAEIPPAEKR